MTNTSSKKTGSVWLKYVLMTISFVLFIYAGWISVFIFPATSTLMERLFVGSIVLVVSAMGLMSAMRVFLGERDMRWPFAIPLAILTVGTGMMLVSIDKVM